MLQFVAPGSPPHIQSGGSGHAPLNPGCPNPGRLLDVFSPLPRTLQSVAPGLPPDDPVRGLGPSSTPPRMLQSGASCFLLSLLSSAMRVWCFGDFFFFTRPSSLLLPRSLRSAVLGTLSRAAVCRVLCALPGFAAPGGRCGLAPVLVPWLWPAACLSGVPRGPALVRRSSSGPVALGAPVGFHVAVVPSPTLGAVAPGFTGWLRGARGGRPRTGLIVPAASPCRGKGAGRAPRRTRSAPRDGVVPGGSLRLRSWAACAAVVWRVSTRSLTRPVSRTVRLVTGDWAGAPGLFRVDADTAPFGSEDATPGSRACVRVHALLGRVGRTGLPGAFWCASPFLCPFLVRSLLVRPPPGWGCPVCGCCCFFFFSFSPSPPCCAIVVSCFACFAALGALGLDVLSPPPFFFYFFLPPPPPVVSGVYCFPVARGLCAPPPFFFFVSCLSFFLFFFAGCAVRGGFVCLGPSGVPACASVVPSLS